MNKKQFLLQLQAVNLIAVDLHLFLDTHPDNKEALNDYEKIEILENSIMNCWQGVSEIKKEAHKGAYQSKYNSSICSNSNNDSNMIVHNDF